eukprot:gene1849-biopygen3902
MLVEALKQRVLHAEVRLEFEEAGVGLPRMTVVLERAGLIEEKIAAEMRECAVVHATAALVVVVALVEYADVVVAVAGFVLVGGVVVAVPVVFVVFVVVVAVVAGGVVFAALVDVAVGHFVLVQPGDVVELVVTADVVGDTVPELSPVLLVGAGVHTAFVVGLLIA